MEKSDHSVTCCNGTQSHDVTDVMLKRTSNRFTWSSLQYVVTEIVSDGLPNSQQAQKAIAKQGVFPMQNLTLHIYPIPISSIPLTQDMIIYIL